MDTFENNIVDELDDNDGALIHLVLDDDTEMDCVVIAFFSAEGSEYEYVALLPVDESMDEEEEGEVLLYRYGEDDGDDLNLTNIESDEEYELAAQAFYEVVEEMAEEEDEDEE